MLHNQNSLRTSASSTLVRSSQALGSRSWVRPPEGNIKCNVDVAVFDLASHFGYGCIVRNSVGVVLDAVFGNMSGSFFPSLAEVISNREALY